MCARMLACRYVVSSYVCMYVCVFMHARVPSQSLEVTGKGKGAFIKGGLFGIQVARQLQ